VILSTLPHIGHILDELYTGGYTAVVDASKFFHQFSTHPADRPYLGVVHPISSTLLQWFGLPMGAANSPSLGGRYALAFLCLLCSEAPHLFGTSGHANCWWTGFNSSGSYDPDLDYGFGLAHPDGLPAVKVWVFVDDFAIHGPDYEATACALRFFFDLSVMWAFCNPVKCAPPL
jgi:hypothetical protein